MSSTSVATAAARPVERSTLVAPMFPLPSDRTSFPVVNFTRRYPNGTLPIKYATTIESNPVMVSKLCQFSVLAAGREIEIKRGRTEYSKGFCFGLRGRAPEGIERNGILNAGEGEMRRIGALLDRYA